jgi:hypothetical protein
MIPVPYTNKIIAPEYIFQGGYDSITVFRKLHMQHIAI